jgi:hypothetical protein
MTSPQLSSTVFLGSRPDRSRSVALFSAGWVSYQSFAASKVNQSFCHSGSFPRMDLRSPSSGSHFVCQLTEDVPIVEATFLGLRSRPRSCDDWERDLASGLPLLRDRDPVLGRECLPLLWGLYSSCLRSRQQVSPRELLLPQLWADWSSSSVLSSPSPMLLSRCWRS